MFFLMGLLGTKVFAADSIYLLLVTYASVLPFGLAFGLSTRLGHLIGEKQFKLARQVSICGCFLPIFTTGFFSITVVIAKTYITQSFSHDPTVIEIANSIAPFAAAFMMLDASQLVGQAILRALSMQTKTVYAVIFSGWFLALPLSITLAFTTKLGLIGAWIGLIVGYCVMLVLFIGLYCSFSW